MQAFCILNGHENYLQEFICINDYCQNQSICCSQCIKVSHSDHESNCFKLNDIGLIIENLFTSRQKQISQQIKQIEFYQEENKNRFKSSILESLMIPISQKKNIKSDDCGKLKKNQILKLINMTQLLNQFIDEIKSCTQVLQNKIKKTFDEINIIDARGKEQSQKEQLNNSLNQYMTLKENYQEKQSKDKNFQDQVQTNQIQQQKKVTSQNWQNEKSQIKSNQKSFEQNIGKLEINYNNPDSSQRQVQDLNQYIDEMPEMPGYNQYQKLLARLKANQEKFIDAQTNKNEFYVFKQTQRISEIPKRQFSFFLNPIGKNVFAKDGQQVKISDTISSEGQIDFFDCLMFYLAQHSPQQLQNIFITTEVNNQGVYAVKLQNDSNKYEILTLDEVIPNSLNLNISQICFLILRKAIAKHYGGYFFFEQFYYIRTLETLFYFPLIVLSYDSENLVEALEEEIACNSFILLDINDQFESPYVVQLIDLIFINDIFNEQTLLIKLKNAHGRMYYKGDWGFESPYWTDDVKLQIKFSNEDDGIFYMDYVSFIKSEPKIYSCRINQKLITEEAFLLKKQQSSYFQFDLKQPDNLTIKFEINQNQKKNMYFQIIVAQIYKNDVTLVDLKYVRYNRSFSLNLKQGQYIFFVKCPYLTETQNNVILQVFGSYQISLNQIQKVEGFKQQVFENQVRKIGKKSQHRGILTMKLDYFVNGWKIFLFENQSQEKTRIEFNLPNLEYPRGVVLCKPLKMNKVTEILHQNQSLLIIMKIYQTKDVEPEIRINQQKLLL